MHRKCSPLRPTARRLALALGALLAAACSTARQHEPPSIELGAYFKEAGNWQPAQPRDAELRGNWWAAYGDADLDRLMPRVLTDNQDLRIAEAQYRIALATTDAARASLFPSLNGSLAATRSRAAASSNSNSGSTRSSSPANTVNLGLTASWEPDLFGRLRLGVAVDRANAEAAAANRAAVMLAMQAQLAQNYFLLRTADAKQSLLAEEIEALDKSLLLTRNRYAAGVATRADVAQAETQLKSTTAQGVENRLTRAQLEHAIAVLLGVAPSALDLAAKPPLAVRLHIPPLLPADLLERRPDVAAAERQVAAANAQMGIAQTAFFPKLTLSATLGQSASSFSQLFSAPARYWSLGPALAATLFDAGQREAAISGAQATHDQAVANYRKTVLVSLQEVEDNLAALRLLDEEIAVQQEAVSAAGVALKLTLNGYKAGTVSYLNVIAAQTAELSARQNLLTLQGRLRTAEVALVRALGGGWKAGDLAGP
ncbi:MAG: efflux transporter outer membrane subunit [Rhodocyclaceae bacterium]|nr:efflux transporter outer membrane subunit [Rhodocyclaceae bacterium]